MKNEFIKYLAGMYPLSEEFVDALRALIVIKTLPKASSLQQTNPTASIWLLEKGLAKGSYDDQEGKEHVTRLWKQGELMLLSHDLATPMSADRIVLLEDSTVSTVSFASILLLYERFAETAKLASRIMLNDRNLAEQRAFLCSLPKRQALREFRKAFPYKRLLHKDIASYLDISRSRLSEIKTKL